MSDYFFYDMNKKMADLANRQQLAEDAQAAPAKPSPLMEAAADYSATKARAGKDIGKPGKNFSKIAAGAAKRYGSAEAGKRVAGAVLNKLRHPTEESIDQAQLKPWKATMKEGGKPDFLDLDKDGNRKEPMKSAARDAKKGLREVDATPQHVDDWTPPAKPAAKASASKPPVAPAPVKPAVKKPAMYPPQAIDEPVKEEGVAEGLANAGETLRSQIIKLYKRGLEDYDIAYDLDIDEKIVADIIDNYDQKQQQRYAKKQGVAEGRKPFRDLKSWADHAKSQGLKVSRSSDSADWTHNATDKQGNVRGRFVSTNIPQNSRGFIHQKGVTEAGVPMTPKQKKFAALAKPFDKITFADKIVGAKKEVDEMLGDVAADAMKKAVGKMGRNRDMEESWIDDAPTRRRSSSGGEIDTSQPGRTIHRAVKGAYSGASHDVSADDEPSGHVGRRRVGAGMGKKIGAKINRGTSKLMTREDDMEESWIDDEPTRRRSSSGGEIDTSKPGVTRHSAVKGNYSGARHDAGDDDEPSGALGRRKVGAGMGKKIGAKINRGTSKLMTREGDMPEDMIKPQDSGEYDQEGAMAKDDIKTVVRHAQALEKILGDNDNLPEWVQAKLAKIEGMMTAVDDYMQNQKSSDTDSEEMDEESTAKRDSRAERAGRKVAKDIEYDEKKKDGIHGKKRGSEDDKAERAGKRVTKDIEYDEKKKDKKKKEVDETTTSGSVATGAAPKTGSSDFGKGIYDSLNRQLENMISESMNINMSMNNDEHGGPRKSLTVTATDDDAEMLAGLLKMAGMGHGDEHIHAMTGDDDMQAIHDMDHEESCSSCGSSTCDCDHEMMDEAYGDTDVSENHPDWPTDEEGTDDAMMYSGGLNGPKSTGQTTVPVIAGQHDRMGHDGDELRRIREMAGIAER